MPAFVSALKRVDLPTFGKPTIPHLMPIGAPGFVIWDWGFASAARGARIPNPESRFFRRRMQPLHCFVEIPLHRERQHVERGGDRTENRLFVGDPRPSEHPGRDTILVARMPDPKPQAVELAVTEMREDVAQSVLTAVPAVELEPRR